jgi:hypothetical protein
VFVFSAGSICSRKANKNSNKGNTADRNAPADFFVRSEHKDMKSGLQIIVIALAIMLCSIPSYARWILPVPDSDGPDPSLPSIQGYISDIKNNFITVEPDRIDGKVSKPVKIRLSKKTQFFTGYGGVYKLEELRPGLYIWVWYITENIGMSGTPPEVAVLMLWSKDPNDKASFEIRWHKNKQKKNS